MEGFENKQQPEDLVNERLDEGAEGMLDRLGIEVTAKSTALAAAFLGALAAASPAEAGPHTNYKHLKSEKFLASYCKHHDRRVELLESTGKQIYVSNTNKHGEKAIYYVADKNGDGSITKNEMTIGIEMPNGTFQRVDCG